MLISLPNVSIIVCVKLRWLPVPIELYLATYGHEKIPLAEVILQLKNNNEISVYFRYSLLFRCSALNRVRHSDRETLAYNDSCFFLHLVK